MEKSESTLATRYGFEFGWQFGWCAGMDFDDMKSYTFEDAPEWEETEEWGFPRPTVSWGATDLGWVCRFEDGSVLLFNTEEDEDARVFVATGEWAALTGEEFARVLTLEKWHPTIAWAHQTVEWYGTNGGGGFATKGIGGGGANGWTSLGECQSCGSWEHFLFNTRGNDGRVFLCVGCAWSRLPVAV